MTKYREIIRLTGLGFSQRNIMASCGVAQKTVVKVQKRARELNISWPLDESMTDTELQRLMFSKENSVSKNKRMPDYDYIHKELLRNGVSKKLLWTEYMEKATLSYAEIKAVATGTPMIREKMEIDNDVQRLKLLKASYDSQRYSLQDNFMIRFPKLIKAAEEKLVCVRGDLKARDAALLTSAD